ncbi:Protein of unknown function [Gryllus bimaculatus]|nr:Protein of unknown function [Gryllus bimaculatus]
MRERDARTGLHSPFQSDDAARAGSGGELSTHFTKGWKLVARLALHLLDDVIARVQDMTFRHWGGGRRAERQIVQELNTSSHPSCGRWEHGGWVIGSKCALPFWTRRQGTNVVIRQVVHEAKGDDVEPLEAGTALTVPKVAADSRLTEHSLYRRDTRNEVGTHLGRGHYMHIAEDGEGSREHSPCRRPQRLWRQSGYSPSQIMTLHSPCRKTYLAGDRPCTHLAEDGEGCTHLVEHEDSSGNTPFLEDCTLLTTWSTHLSLEIDPALTLPKTGEPTLSEAAQALPVLVELALHDEGRRERARARRQPGHHQLAAGPHDGVEAHRAPHHLAHGAPHALGTRVARTGALGLQDSAGRGRPRSAGASAAWRAHARTRASRLPSTTITHGKFKSESFSHRRMLYKGRSYDALGLSVDGGGNGGLCKARRTITQSSCSSGVGDRCTRARGRQFIVVTCGTRRWSQSRAASYRENRWYVAVW